MKPKISMLVLSYKGAERMIPTLESCKLQTSQDKELIIADDASPDGGKTVKIIEDWLSKNEGYFKRIEFIKHDKNLGIVKNLRNAALKSSGEVILGLGQGDLIYGPETIERIEIEIEKQRNSGLEDPYIWLSHFMSFKINGSQLEKNVLNMSQPWQFNLIENHPKKALDKMIHGNFIGGPSIIYSKSYFSDGIFPIPNSIHFIEDWTSLLWMLINKHRFGFINQFTRWYEEGVGICSVANPRIDSDTIALITWIKNISPKAGKEMEEHYLNIDIEYRRRCKNRWQRIMRHPIVFFGNVMKFIFYKIPKITGFEDRWIHKIEKISSTSFSDELFLSEYYPEKSSGIF